MKKKMKKLNLKKFESNVLDFKSQQRLKGGSHTTSTGVSVTAAVSAFDTESEVIDEYDF